MSRKQAPTSKTNSGKTLAIWIAIGIGVGTAIGAAVGDVAVWTAFGVPIGVAAYGVITLLRKRDKRGGANNRT